MKKFTKFVYDHAGSVPRLVAVAMLIGVLAGIGGGFVGSAVRNAELETWSIVDAAIVSDPLVQGGKGNRKVVTAFVETASGERTNLAVAEQAQPGDIVKVYLNRESGDLYRATSVWSSPLTNTTDWILASGVLASLACFVASVSAILVEDKRRTREKNSGSKMPAYY